MARLRHIAREGEYVDESDYCFIVSQATERAVMKLRVESRF